METSDLNPSVMCTSKSKLIDDRLILIKLSKKSSLSTLRNCPLDPADALFLSCGRKEELAPDRSVTFFFIKVFFVNKVKLSSSSLSLILTTNEAFVLSAHTILNKNYADESSWAV